MDLGHLVQILVLLSACAVGWGIFQTRLEENHQALVRVEGQMSKIGQDLLNCRERQIELRKELDFHVECDRTSNNVRAVGR